MTVLEHRVVDEIALFDNEHARQKELLCCISSDGMREIDRALGTINLVQLPQTLDTLLAADEGIRLFHNHPSQGSLSTVDWRQSIRWDGKADVIAINGQRTIFSGNAKDVPALTTLLESVDLDEVRDYGERALFTADCPADSHRVKPIAVHLVSHILNLELQTRGLSYYDFHLSERDQVILNACNDLLIWNSVSAEIARRLG